MLSLRVRCWFLLARAGLRASTDWSSTLELQSVSISFVCVWGEKGKIDEKGVTSILSHNVMNRSSTHTHSLLIDSKQQETEIETFVLLLFLFWPDRREWALWLCLLLECFVWMCRLRIEKLLFELVFNERASEEWFVHISIDQSIWISVLEVTLKEIHRCVADACLLSLLLPLTDQRREVNR